MRSRRGRRQTENHRHRIYPLDDSDELYWFIHNEYLRWIVVLSRVVWSRRRRREGKGRIVVMMNVDLPAKIEFMTFRKIARTEDTQTQLG